MSFSKRYKRRQKPSLGRFYGDKMYGTNRVACSTKCAAYDMNVAIYRNTFIYVRMKKPCNNRSRRMAMCFLGSAPSLAVWPNKGPRFLAPE